MDQKSDTKIYQETNLLLKIFLVFLLKLSTLNEIELSTLKLIHLKYKGCKLVDFTSHLGQQTLLNIVRQLS